MEAVTGIIFNYWNPLRVCTASHSIAYVQLPNTIVDHFHTSSVIPHLQYLLHHGLCMSQILYQKCRELRISTRRKIPSPVVCNVVDRQWTSVRRWRWGLSGRIRKSETVGTISIEEDLATAWTGVCCAPSALCSILPMRAVNSGSRLKDLISSSRICWWSRVGTMIWWVRTMAWEGGVSYVA